MKKKKEKKEWEFLQENLGYTLQSSKGAANKGPEIQK